MPFTENYVMKQAGDTLPPDIDRRCGLGLSAADRPVGRHGPGCPLQPGRRSPAGILDVLGVDGHPPFIVKWLAGGNIAVVDPDPYALVIPAEFG
jgi:hypothetical protein